MKHPSFMVLLCALGCSAQAGHASVAPVDGLTCEALVDPACLDCSAPRLSWRLADRPCGARQTAYRVLVGSSADMLAHGKGDLWDSGEVQSDQSVFVSYAGRPLHSRQTAFWKVRIKDQKDEWSPWSAPASWRMGLLDSTDWGSAQWIRIANDTRNSALLRRPFVREKGPAVERKTLPSPVLRKEFQINKPVKQAMAYVCGLGYFELYVNGEKTGDHVLDPVQTTYDKRACYVGFDITRQLQSGGNAVGLMLGNGFHGQDFAFGTGLVYGPPVAIGLLAVEYTDGTTEAITTGPDWKAAMGPVVFDNVYVGETYDARLEIPGWNRPGFDDRAWQSAATVAAPTKKLIAQMVPPMKKTREVSPVGILPGTNGTWIVDMGQNMTGWLRIRVQGESGRQIRMRFGEVLMPDGNEIDTATTGTHVTGGDQTDIYVCKGGGVEEWEPRFTYHGFRYVQIDGLDQRPQLSDFTGWLVRTDVERIGSFQCSDELINTFYNVSMWTIEDNLQGVLSDCPHRERCAWMGDMHAVGEAASYNFDLMQFWRKSSADMETVLGAAAPRKEGGLPRDPRAPCNISVGKRLCQQARPDWGAATVLVPWFNWLYFGDFETVQTAWPMMTGWMDFLAEFAVKDGIIEEGYGDWCPPGSNSQIDTPVALTSTAFYYQSLEAMRRMAAALGKSSDAARYAAQAEVVKQAFIARFYNPANHHFGSQTGTAVALHSGLAPDGQEQAVADGLAWLVMEKSEGRYTTGIFGHRPLYTELNDYGHDEVTRHLWTVEGWPSLRFLTEEHGLTTWPETPFNWPKGERYRRNSFNHPMQSGFAATFHESLGGIRPDPAQPGFKHILLQPCFLQGLEWVKAEHRSPYGMISSHWTRTGSSIVWNITVPANSSATVNLSQFKASEITLSGEPVITSRFELQAGAWYICVGGKQ